ncbi:MAG: hypothetical protein ACRC35_05610 [Angustibacter sp.]
MPAGGQLLVIGAVLAIGLTACGSTGSNESAGTSVSSSEPSVEPSVMASLEEKAGIPPEPSGPARATLLKSLKKIDQGISADEEKAVSATRNQCAAINNDAKDLAVSAAERFSYRGNKISVSQGQDIVDLLKKSGACEIR